MAPAIDTQTHGMGGDSPMLRAMMDNRAVLACYEPLTLPGAADPGRLIVFGDDGSRVSDIVFTPNRIRFDVQTGSRPARVALNMTYLSGWRASVGEIEIDPGTGLALGGLGLLLAGVALRIRRWI